MGSIRLAVAAALAVIFSSAAGAQTLPDPAHVLATLERAARAEEQALLRRPLPLFTGNAVDRLSSNWVSAAFFVGDARLARVSRDPEHLRFLVAAAEHFNYALRGADSPKTMLNADDIAIGDLYEELYARRDAPGVLMPLRQRLDFMLPHLSRRPAPEKLVWWWCDALFMAPPVLARMSALTGERAYLDAMDAQWWRTYERLYDASEHLYFRDARFIGRRSGNGAKIFWSRGNGWAMAGLARVLESMPADYPSRERYLATFREMADRIAGLQRKDGLWRTNLLDPAVFPYPETSGSAFYVYALAWGINHRLLEREKYLPHVLKGWMALNRHLLKSGLLGSVQKTGDQPVAILPTDTGPYGQGGFLLAGLEVMNLGKPATGLPLVEPAQDDAATIAATTPRPPAPVTVRGPAETARHAAEMKAVAALAYDPWEDAVAPQGGVVPPVTDFALAKPPADMDRPMAVVRFAPYRYDDLLYENDRIAHRIYGPALEGFEPPSGSGIDVWGKNVRRPFMERQLATGAQHGYHGEGLDHYNVGVARGAGGLGIWFDNKLWVSRNYKTYKILKTDGDEARFEVSYAPWPVDVVRKVWETRVFSLPLGSNFTRMVSTIASDKKSSLIVGIGINKHATSDKTGEAFRDASLGILSVWEKTDPDKGTFGVALKVDPKTIRGFAQDNENFYVLVKVLPGKPFVYYSGAVWDKGLDFHTREDWDAYVKTYPADFDPKR
jgi:rhamnogalacturonyl hydrolase YesR